MKTVLLTGAAGNLGSVVTRAFLEKGWHVHAAVFSQREQDSLATLRTDSNLSLAHADLSTPEDAQNFVATAPHNIMALVHLVGGIKAGTLIEETAPDVFESMVSMNMRTTFNVLHFALPVLKANATKQDEAKGASIVAVGAKAVLHPEQKKSAYAAAKAGVINLILSAAEEGRASGVRANAIVPSIIRTPANMEWASNGEERDWVTPEQIASTILFLCSEESSGISGAVLPMYGGIPA